MLGGFFNHDDSFDPTGRKRMLRKWNEQQAMLDENPKIYEMDEGTKIKTVAKGYITRRGTAYARKWAGKATDEHLTRIREEREIYTLSKPDGSFKAVYELLGDDWGHLILVNHPKSNGWKLRKHMEILRKIFFYDLKLKMVRMRAAIPTDDLPMNVPDRRMEMVIYETPNGTQRRTRLFKTWLTLCRGCVPSDHIERTTADELAWLSPAVEIDEEVRNDLNSMLPFDHRWQF